MIERTLVIIKPDGVERNLIGEIIRKYENAGLKVVLMKMINLSRQFVEGFYAEHLEKAFFRGLCEFMISGLVVVLVLEGERCIEAVRAINGATDSLTADVGTIRGDYGDRTVVMRKSFTLRILLKLQGAKSHYAFVER